MTKQVDSTAQQLKEQLTLNTLLKDQVNSLKIKLSTVTQFNPSADRALELAAKYKDELALRDVQNKTLLREKHILENKLQ